MQIGAQSRTRSPLFGPQWPATMPVRSGSAARHCRRPPCALVKPLAEPAKRMPGPRAQTVAMSVWSTPNSRMWTIRSGALLDGEITMATDSRGPTNRGTYSNFTYYERLVTAGGEPTVNDAMSAALAQNWWAIALRGAFAILFGLVGLLLPEVTLLALVLLFAAYMLLDGILAIIAGVRAARRHDRWGWLIVEGVVDLVAGVIAVIWPLITIVAFVFLLGAWAIVTGVLLFGASFRLHIAHGRWLMALAGAISVVWGVLAILWPITGALTLTWLLAAYALFFGVVLLFLAFRLRSRRHALRPGTFPQRP